MYSIGLFSQRSSKTGQLTNIMEKAIQREIKEMLPFRKWIPNDIFEMYMDYAALYSKEYWLILQDEYLRRMECEIAII